MSKIIELSVSEDGNFYDITTQLNYMQEFNSNGIKLIGNSLDDNVKTLKDTPVVAYLDYRWMEKDDFGGHEAYIDHDGDIRFSTQSVGHTKEVWVENKMVKPVFEDSEKILPVIMAKSRIYASRFPEYSKVLKRLFSEDKLGVSWELEPKSMKDEQTDIEAIPSPRSTDNYEFLGYTLLGSTITPAYGSMAKVLEISEDDRNKVNAINEELSKALKEDIKTASASDFNKLSEVSEEEKQMEENLKELQTQLSEANAKLKEYAEADKEKEIAELKGVLEVLTTEKSEVEAKLVEASEKLQGLSEEVSTLRASKEELDKIMAEKAELEKVEKAEALKQVALDGGYIKSEELETSEEIKAMIENCDENGIKLLKAERIIASAKVEEPKTKSVKKELSEEIKVEKNLMDSFLV